MQNTSEDWEVVVRSKKEKTAPNGKPKTVTDEKKKFLESAPKTAKKGPFEESPNFFKSLDKDDDKKAKKEKPKQSVPSQPQNKKQSEKKSPDIPKVKPPKTLEQALSKITPESLEAAYSANPGAETLPRLLDMARCFNTKIPVDQNDEIYSECPLEYPLSAVPSPIRSALDKCIKDDKNASLQQFLELCLSSIPNNMIKSLPATGYKIIIQLIAQINPKLFTSCVSKVVYLMNSYQNRPPIGMSLLWAIGQAGIKDLGVGLQVWRELMVPMIDMRHYVKYIINYLVHLLKTHISNEDNKRVSIKSQEFLSIFDFLHARRKGIPKELEMTLNTRSPVLRKFYFEKSDSWKKTDIMEPLLERLSNEYPESKQKFDMKAKELVTCIIESLRKRDTSYKTWRDVNSKYPAQSSQVLKYIELNWSSVSPLLDKNQLKNCILQLKESFQQMLKIKKKDLNQDGIRESITTCQKILNKMARSRGFPWVKGCFLLLPLIAGTLLAYDVQKSGSFEKSTSGVFLKNVGALETCQYAWSRSLAASARGYKWAEKNTPYYYHCVVEAGRPYAELTRDMFILGVNNACTLYGNIKEYAVEKAPVVYSAIDHYVPGFLSTVQAYSVKAWNVVRDYQSYYCEIVATYLKTKVFIDNWAPELIQARTLQALNTTQLYAAQYYNWFYKHVDDYSKIQ